MKKNSPFVKAVWITAAMFLFFLAGYATGGQLKTASIFGDHMVIQRGIHAPVWGTALPGEKVVVDFAGYTTTAPVDQTGSWIVRMPVLQQGGPFSMTIRSGTDTIRYSDVMVGEVWLASGQSNMAWTVGAGIGPDTDAETASADYPGIRYFTVPPKTSVVPLKDTEPATWMKVTPETVKNLSAVAYFFSRELHRDKNLAVGIISSSWGATNAHAWISPEMLATHPDFTEIMAKSYKDPAQWDSIVHQNHLNDKNRDSIANACKVGIEKGVFRPDFDDSHWKAVTVPINMDKTGMPGFWGVSWFRKTFDVPAGMKGKAGSLKLYARAREIKVFLNGKEIATAGNPEGEISLDIPKGLLNEGRNVLAMRMYQVWGTGLIGSPESNPSISVANGKLNVMLDGEWHSSGAIEPPVPGNQGYYNYYSVQYNARIAPVIPYGIRGVLWYQGEGNAYRAHQYRTLFPLVIQDWRTRWGLGYFPFLYVQLANHKMKQSEPSDDEFAELREAQALALSLPNTGMACAIDIGDPLDIHPRNKLDVGKRLYLAARKVAYGEDLVHSGPLFKSMEVDGATAKIRFSSTGSGLLTRDGGKLRGFAIAGADRKFYWAEATLSGDEVWVSSPKVGNPIAVRYSWEINPDGNLINREGLPAVPFRTDDFKMVTDK
jgi:sialate O-acetylesterase